MPRKLKPEEEALFQAAMKEVAPLKKGAKASVPVPKQPPKAGPRRTPEVPFDPPPLKTAGPPKNPVSITAMDGSRARRLQRGQLPIEGRLDLHGMTRDKAYRTLTRFLARAQAEDKRVILVITGKGGAPRPDPDNVFVDSRTGILRHAVPQWLGEGENAARVTAWHPAHPKHGGDGALYVVLKRLR